MADALKPPTSMRRGQRGLVIALALCVLGCGGNTPTSPTTPQAQAATGALEGIVNHESYLASLRLTTPIGPLAGARVVVTEGAGVGATVTTGADGAYHFDLPPGQFRVRWSADSFETRDSDASNVQAGRHAGELRSSPVPDSRAWRV